MPSLIVISCKTHDLNLETCEEPWGCHKDCPSTWHVYIPRTNLLELESFEIPHQRQDAPPHTWWFLPFPFWKITLTLPSTSYPAVIHTPLCKYKEPAHSDVGFDYYHLQTQRLFGHVKETDIQCHFRSHESFGFSAPSCSIFVGRLSARWGRQMPSFNHFS